MTADDLVLTDLQVSGCQYAIRLGAEWKSSDPHTVRRYGLPPHFNFDAIALHRQGTKVAARAKVPSLDLDVHANETDIRTMQMAVNDEIQYSLRADGFEGVVDQSSSNGGLHIRLKMSITKCGLQDWFTSKGLTFPEYFGPETKTSLGLPAFDNGLSWSLQDPTLRVRGFDSYAELWTSLPEGTPHPNTENSRRVPPAQEQHTHTRIKTSVPLDTLAAPDQVLQARLRQACGDSPIPHGQRFRSQPGIVDAAIFRAGLGGLPRDVLIANLVAHMLLRGRNESPTQIAKQIAILVDEALARKLANRTKAKSLAPRTTDPTTLVLAAVLSRHAIGDVVPIAGAYIQEVTGLTHRRGHALVKRGLEGSGHLRRVVRGSNLNGRCDRYLIIAK